jgi:CHAD domain-containing protein
VEHGPERELKLTASPGFRMPSVSEIGDDTTAGEVLRRAIGLSVIRLIRHDPVIRLDADAEGVHQARVATRRLRSDLRTFRSLVDRDWSSALRDELGWLAGVLGTVRDGDVLLARLRTDAAALPGDERRDTGAVLTTLDKERNEAYAALLDALRSRRYGNLLDALVAAANAPAFGDRAGAPAAEVVPELVRGPWKKLDERLEALGSAPSDEQLHALRIRTKRARYAAEAAFPVVGKPARELAKAAARLQSVLGDLNDAVVTAARLEAWAVSARSPVAARGAEALASRERAQAERARGAWPAAARELTSPGLRRWM